MSELGEYPDEVSPKTVVLEKLQYGLRQVLPQGVRTETSAYQDAVMNSMVAEIRAYVLAKRLPSAMFEDSKVVEFKTPATVWQLWKENHKAGFLLRRFVRRHPVRYRTQREVVMFTVNMERYATFPESEYAWPDKLGRPVFTYTFDKDWEES